MSRYPHRHAHAGRIVIDRLVAIRKQRGLSQREVARRAGVDSSYVSKVEHHLHDPSLSFVLCYARAVGVRLVAEVVV